MVFRFSGFGKTFHESENPVSLFETGTLIRFLVGRTLRPVTPLFNQPHSGWKRLAPWNHRCRLTLLSLSLQSVTPLLCVAIGITRDRERQVSLQHLYRVLAFSGNRVLLSLLTALLTAACAAAGRPAFLACSSLMSASTWATPWDSDIRSILRLFDCCITPSSSNAPNRVNSGLLGWFLAVIWGCAVITRTPRPWSHAQRSAHTPASTGPRRAAAPCPRPSTPDPPQPARAAAP